MNPKNPVRPRNLDWRPYLFLLLLPLMFLGLDSFSIFIKTTESNQATGIWPRFIEQAPQTLHLSLPEGALQASGLQISGPQGTIQIPATIKDSDWQVTIPRLAAGQYQLQLLAGKIPYGPQYPLGVRPTSPIHLRLNQLRYSPGEWAILSLYLTPEIRQWPALKLEVLAPDGRTLLAAPVASVAGLWPFKVHLPQDIATGQAYVRITSASRTVLQQKIKIDYPSAPVESMQVVAYPQAILAGQKQELEFQVLDPQGQLAEEAWIRILGQTVSVKQGHVRLSAQNPPTKVPFTAGDSKGNLLQGELHFELHHRSWLAQYLPSQKIQLQARRDGHISWLLGTGQTIRAQGQQDLKTGSQILNLPELQSGGSYWLYICDSFGLCQDIHWQQDAQSVNWNIQPANPHALESIRFSPDRQFNLGNGALESFRKQFLAYEVKRSELSNPESWLQAVGFPAPTQTPAGVLFGFLLLSFFVLMSPLYWFWQQSKLFARSRPFPHPIQRQRVMYAQLGSMALSATGLICVCLSWFQHTQAAVLVASVSSLTTGLLFVLWLRKTLKHLHPLAKWVPFLQACLISTLFWFVLTYQPGVLGAVCLLLSLLALAWTHLWQEQIQIRRLENAHILNLASLVVMMSMHLLLITTNKLVWPIPQWQQANHLLQSYPQHLAMQTQLLNYQSVMGISDQVMPASNRSGKQIMQWRIWPSPDLLNRPEQERQQALTVQPVVLAQAQLPNYAYLGDEIQVPVQLTNETASRQSSVWQLGNQGEHAIELKGRSSQRVFESLSLTRSSWNFLQLSHQFQGKWYHQNLRIFGIATESPQEVPDLQLDLRLPAHQNLVPEEEIPVLVRFKHRSASPQSLGLQIHLPAASVALTDTLSEQRHQKWLAHFKQTEENLQIQTRILEPGQEISFHFRLRMTLPGKYQMPSPRLFYLDQPQRATVLNIAERLEVKTP